MSRLVATITSSFVDLLEKNKITVESLKDGYFDFREIYDILDYPRNVKGIHNHLDFLNYLGNEYGSIAKYSFFYFMLRDYMYENDGAYEHAFNREYLTSDICQQVKSDEFYDLDILKTVGKEFTEALDNDEIYEHFCSVKIQTDDREYITRHDKEHDEMCKSLINLTENNPDHETNPCELYIDNRGEFDTMANLKFLNPRESEIANIDEVKKSGDKLRYLFDAYSIEDEILNCLTMLIKSQPKRVVIDLKVCSQDDEPDTLKGSLKDNLFFSDFICHPKDLLKSFEGVLKTCEHQNKNLIVDTYSDHLVNLIRHKVFKKEVLLKDNSFTYTDTDNVKYNIGIDSNGKYIPEFPEGFFDVTIRELFEINKGND